MTAPRRPAGHGAGLEGPVCPQRAQPQFPTVDGPVRYRMCIRCGRVTARVDADGVGWCGGEFPAEPPLAVELPTSQLSAVTA